MSRFVIDYAKKQDDGTFDCVVDVVGLNDDISFDLTLDQACNITECTNDMDAYIMRNHPEMELFCHVAAIDYQSYVVKFKETMLDELRKHITDNRASIVVGKHEKSRFDLLDKDSG